jgi:MinD-like ATPase involved in chromosome partitioning or flagellar assembly
VRIVFALGASQALADEAERYGHQSVGSASDAAELERLVTTAPVDLVIVSAAPSFLSEHVLSICDNRGVRIIAAVANDKERRHASTLGLYEFTDAAATWVDYERLVTGATVPRVSSPASGRGTVIAVWGPAGAPGRTAVAIGIAAELALAGHSVALGDVDTHGASIAPALGMLDEAPGFAAACRLAGAQSLTRTELERIGQQYSIGKSTMWVLTGIGRPSRWPELSGDRVRGAIDQCRSWVDYTVLDTGFSLETDEEISSDLFAPKRNGATIAAVREADTVVAVGAADPVGMSRFLRAHVDLLELCDPDRIQVVMNKVRASAVGLNPAGQVTQTLSRFGGIDTPALVPWDQAGYDAAILSGRTLAEVAPKSQARVAIRELVNSRLLGRRTSTLARRLVRG